MTATSAQTRLISLDIFRGMTIAAMILVNNPGGSPVYWPLDHAEWNGLTPTDWIFPFFLFIVGVAIPIALGKRIRQGITGSVYTKILTRAATIFGLGLAISVLPFFQFTTTNAPDWLKMSAWLALAASLFFLLIRNFRAAAILGVVGFAVIGVMNLAGYNVVPYDVSTMRIFGVLQRIGVCYAVTSIVYLHTDWRQQIYISIALLLGYWFVMTNFAVPGCEVTTIDDKACNFAAYIDRLVLTENHIWRFGKVYDPEGILSTIPAIVTTISGVLTGTWLARMQGTDGTNNQQKRDLGAPAFASSASSLNSAGGMFFFGVVLFALGWIWNSYFPFNKALWTSSYVLVTSGLALLVFASCYWLVDIKGYQRWARPFMIFGANALALFVFSGIFARMIAGYKIAGPDGAAWSLQKWAVQTIFLFIFQPINASLAFAVTFILFWLLLMWLLYRRRIYIKV